MLRPNQGRARAARLVFMLLAIVSALLLGLTLALPPVAPSTDVSEVAAGTSLLYVGLGLLSLLYLMLLVGSYVALIMWLRRAYYNLHQLPDIHPEFSDGWAAGAWFVPFLNLVRPYTIMREVWQDTQRAALSGRIVRPATVLGWWWAAFILKFVVGRITWAMTRGSDSDFSSQDLLATALDAGAQLLAAGLTWYVIGQAAQFEEQLAMRQQLDQLGQPAPAPDAALPVEQSDYWQPEGY